MPDPSPNLDSLSSLTPDGSRRMIHPADVKGRFVRWRKIVFVFLIGILLSLPWIKIGGNPAILLDLPARQFFLMGRAFNSQDAWLIFFLLTGLGFSLVVVTTLFGRVWCGWSCPQTVFIEGIYRQLERWIDGPGAQRRKLENSPWDAKKIGKRVLKHSLYIAVSMLLAHALLGYFVPIRQLWAFIRTGPGTHPEAFAWVTGVTVLVYVNFGWFREQFCIIVCPYGRLQSVMVDDHSLVVGYDTKRGEPRGKLNVLNNGDCVDCKRCIAVCPTGIDIRNGLQLECIGCTACIDACDEIMLKVQKPTGLIRYDSLHGFAGKPARRWLRPRTIAYAVLGLIGLTVLLFSLRTSKPFEANLIKPKGVPFVMQESNIQNQLKIHIINKSADAMDFEIKPQAIDHVQFIIPQSTIHIQAHGTHEIPIFVLIPKANYTKSFDVTIQVTSPQFSKQQVVSARFTGPN
jgi:cytochrome c oxidase accessory protein FixG